MQPPNIYKLCINNRNYSDWHVSSINSFEKLNIPINPFENKLFHSDTFYFSENNTDKSSQVKIVYSNIRDTTNIPCVLILENNKTYGRHNKNKLLYKCVPDDFRLPYFLVPYEMKRVGFSKSFTNLYVTIQYSSWDVSSKHPIGILDQVIGQINNLPSYYEYVLYCKSLNHSIQNFTKQATKAIESASKEDNLYFSGMEKRTMPEWEIFTIDPECSMDFDDAFSIKKLTNNEFLLSIYISNVPIMIDKLNLWDSFSKRVSTIYLPDKKRPMLPNNLSEGLCSLIQNATRAAFVLDLWVIDNKVDRFEFKPCLIKVHKNYRYEEKDLLYNKSYNLIYNLTNNMLANHGYLKTIEHSHDVVCYLMVFMNCYAAEDMLKYNNGIFRSNASKTSVLPNNLPKDIYKYIYIWKKNSSQYIDYSKCTNETDIKHEMLEVDSYIHITSPIRRLVDLLNMIRFQINNGMYKFTDKAIEFYNSWTKEIDYINTSMYSINKLQTNCDLLFKCFTNSQILENVYEGYCFDKVIKNDFINQYNVFIPGLRVIFTFKGKEDIQNYQKRSFKLYIFENEENSKKKIRLQLIE